MAITFEKVSSLSESQMKIKYYIESPLCKGISFEQEFYIEGELTNIDNDYDRSHILQPNSQM